MQIPSSTENAESQTHGLTAALPPGHHKRGLLAALLVGTAILVSWPVSQIPLGDEFSYVQTAWDFARTGHLVYNGWGAPMLGWMAAWGALFARLFGYSTDVLRFSILLLAIACIYLFHEILLRFGLGRKPAFFCALTLGLSPLYLPLSASFQTDIPGLFVILLCIRMCQGAVLARTDLSRVAWLVAAAGTNAIGGTVRQICWLGVLVMVPATAWYLRRYRYVLVATVISCSVGAAIVWLCLHWLSHQMYSVPEPFLPRQFLLHNVVRMLTQCVKALLFVSLVTAPLGVAALMKCSRFNRNAFIRLGVLLCLASVAWLKPWHGDLDKALMPWLEPVLVTQGMAEPHTALDPATVLHIPVRIVLSTLVVLLAWALIESTLLHRRLVQRKLLQRSATFWILVPFSLTVFLLLMPRAYEVAIQDRYLLLLLPAVLPFLTFVLDQRQGLRFPRTSYAILAIFCAYAIAGLHDQRSAARALERAVATLTASGVPRTSIVEGFGPDELVQVAHTGHVNNPGMWPLDLYRPLPSEQFLPPPCSILLQEEAPVIQPDFIVVFRITPCVAATNFPSSPYTTWLPPYGRAIYIGRPVRK